MAGRYLRFRINIIWPDIIKNPGRTMKRVMRRALYSGLEYWRDTLLPLHFKETAYWRYGKSGQDTMRPDQQNPAAQLYKRRATGNFAVKMSGERGARTERMESDPRPIYFTGRTEEMVMSTARGESERKWPGTTSTSASARMKFVVPNYIKAHQQNRAAAPGFAETMPHYPMIDELTVVNEQEREQINDRVTETLDDLLSRHGNLPDLNT